MARSETDTGTRRIRPESTVPRNERVKAHGPQVDVDEFLGARDAETASDDRWRVRLDGQALWWATDGGYTTNAGSARKWPCRWDAYDHMLGRDLGNHTWDVELVRRPQTLAAVGVSPRTSFYDLSQAWTGFVVTPADGRRRPRDGMVHALVGENVPGWALYGEQVGYWAKGAWPPRGMQRCDRCASIAEELPRG